MNILAVEKQNDINQVVNSGLKNRIKTKAGLQANILIVEDNYILQKVVMGQLEEMGCGYDLAEDGQTALALFRKNNYDLILLDIGLPDINGIEVCKQIRTETRFHIPIIGITAFGTCVEPGCIQAGVDDFYVKPVSMDTLKACLTKHLQ
jgi:DNA-binding response OmpR family regulator